MEAYLEKVRLQKQQSATSGEVLNSHLHSSSELACIQGEGMPRDLAYIHPLSSSITCAVSEAVSFMRFLFFLVSALCSLLTPLISYSLFCFLIFKHMSSCIYTHMLTSVSHSHSYSVSDVHILFIITPSALSPAVVP